MNRLAAVLGGAVGSAVDYLIKEYLDLSCELDITDTRWLSIWALTLTAQPGKVPGAALENAIGEQVLFMQGQIQAAWNNLFLKSSFFDENGFFDLARTLAPVQLPCSSLA
jgi:hypothetical protein